MEYEKTGAAAMPVNVETGRLQWRSIDAGRLMPYAEAFMTLITGCFMYVEKSDI